MGKPGLTKPISKIYLVNEQRWTSAVCDGTDKMSKHKHFLIMCLESVGKCGVLDAPLA